MPAIDVESNQSHWLYNRNASEKKEKPHSRDRAFMVPPFEDVEFASGQVRPSCVVQFLSQFHFSKFRKSGDEQAPRLEWLRRVLSPSLSWETFTKMCRKLHSIGFSLARLTAMR